MPASPQTQPVGLDRYVVALLALSDKLPNGCPIISKNWYHPAAKLFDPKFHSWRGSLRGWGTKNLGAHRVGCSFSHPVEWQVSIAPSIILLFPMGQLWMERKNALRNKFFMGAPRQQKRFGERSKIVREPEISGQPLAPRTFGGIPRRPRFCKSATTEADNLAGRSFITKKTSSLAFRRIHGMSDLPTFLWKGSGEIGGHFCDFF